MGTMGEVKTRIRSLVEDEEGDFATDGYLIPKINQVYGQAIGMLEDASCNPFLTEVRPLLRVPAGTTILDDAIGYGKPWEGLQNPVFLEVKRADDAPEEYTEVPMVTRLPNVSPITDLQPGIVTVQRRGAVEWRSDTLFITPFAFDADFQLRGDFRPPRLLKDEDRVRVHYEMTEFLAYAGAALVGSARSNAGWKNDYGTEAQLVLNRIASKLTKQSQSGTFKFARTGSRRRIW